MVNVVLFGPPGAGKGTQSEILIQKHGLVHISTGNILRAEIAAGTPLGQEAKRLMDDGKLVPDAVVIGMVENTIADNPQARGFIFDGFPRTVAQAEALDTMLAKHGMGITCMVGLEVPLDELTRRLLKRAEMEGRTDDNADTIRKRFDEYQLKTLPVADYYRRQNKFHGISGLGSIEEIATAVDAVVCKPY